MITGKSGDIVTVKPSQSQIQSTAKRIICDSFKPIPFSGKGDTQQTIKDIREHNAAWESYCK
jgi:ribosomal protein S10